MKSLYEKWRPSTFDDVIGQPKVIAQVKRLAVQGLAGRAYWISGASGTGKTTIARLIASEVAGEFDMEELDAGACTPNRLSVIERESCFKGMTGPGGRAYIVNESHGLSKAAIRQLLVTLERIPQHVCWIFTTTTAAEATLFEDCDDAGPLLSRCLQLNLTNQGLAPLFAAKAKEIAEFEGLDGKPIARYVKLVQDCKNNMRAVLCEIEAGRMLE